MSRNSIVENNTVLGNIVYYDGKTEHQVSIIENLDRVRARYNYEGILVTIGDYKVREKLDNIFNLGHLVENQVQIPYPEYKTFSTFNVKSYMPESCDEEFLSIIEEVMERIKTAYPYANCDFASVRLPGLHRKVLDELEAMVTAGCYETNANTISFGEELDEELELDTYLHEFIHLSSALALPLFKEDYEVIGYPYACGFQDKQGNGVGINEGMTEYLANNITGEDGTYYLNRRLLKSVLALCPDEKEFIKKYFECDLSALDFIGDKVSKHKFIQNFDLLHWLDDDLYTQYAIQVDENAEAIKNVYATENDMDIDDIDEEIASELEIDAYEMTEKFFCYDLKEADFLPNCQDILLDCLNEKLKFLDKEEKEELIKSFACTMIFSSEVKEVNRIEGFYALNPRFIDIEKLEENDKKFFDVCMENGYSEDEIKSIYSEATSHKETIVENRYKAGYMNCSLYDMEYDEMDLDEDYD